MEEMNEAIEQQQALTAALRESYEDSLTDEMGKLYNQFVGFVALSQMPLPHALMVIEMVKADIIDQANTKYKGG